MKRPGIRVAFSVAWTDEAGESVFRVNPPSLLLPHKQNVIRRSSADIITRAIHSTDIISEIIHECQTVKFLQYHAERYIILTVGADADFYIRKFKKTYSGIGIQRLCSLSCICLKSIVCDSVKERRIEIVELTAVSYNIVVKLAVGGYIDEYFIIRHKSAHGTCIYERISVMRLSEVSAALGIRAESEGCDDTVGDIARLVITSPLYRR